MLPDSNSVRSQSGQIGVIILLIMVVLLTAGLSLATRTTQELFLSQQTADSARVFNAAEAGIEQALSTDLNFAGTETTGSVSSVDDATVNYTIKKVDILETRLFEGVTVMVDTTGVVNGQGLVVEWSKETNCATQDPASLMASIYSVNAGVTSVRFQALRGCDRADGFTASVTQAGSPYYFRHNLALQTNDVIVRLTPMYNDTHIRVAGDGWTLPVQYYNIRSEAQNTEGDEVRIVEVNRTLPTAPSVMDYAVYSGTTLDK